MSTSLPDLGSSGARSKSSALCPRFALALGLLLFLGGEVVNSAAPIGGKKVMVSHPLLVCSCRVAV